MSELRIGSLCTGTGALDMSVQSVLDADLAWVADPDPGATRILAHHHPTTPNLGDITKTDWSTVPAVDVLTAGFPCQDISYAGRGAGIKKGTRSGIFYALVEAVRVLRPRLVFLENVAGITTRRPGLDVVLAELAGLGFDAEWCTVRASDVGAPHPRNRWFLVAWPTAEDAHVQLGGEWRQPAPRQAQGRRARADAGGRGGAPAAHADGIEPQRRGIAGLVGGASAAQPREGDQRKRSRDSAGDCGAEVEWGPYAGAVDRWERVLGRSAPVPTEPGRTGQRLSPRFVEWMMGLPEGHVTSPGIGLKRGQQLHALGNGVVPQQGAMALRLLLERATAVDAA